MGGKAKSSSSLAGTVDWDTVSLEGEHLDRLGQLLKDEGQPQDALVLAQKLLESHVQAAAAPSASPVRVKKYDHRCNYEEGERVFVDNRYGQSLATVTKIVRQPPTAFCDKAFLDFDDDDYRARWEAERSTPYFAIHSGRANVPAVYVDASERRSAAPRRTRSNATAVVKLARRIDSALSADDRFTQTPSGWQLAGQPTPAKPHISAEPGGAAPGSPALSQGCYKAPLLAAIDQMGEATIEDIKRNVQTMLKLTSADWETDSTGKIVWIHRLHAAIKHLKRVGAIDSPRREVYRRVGLQKVTA